MKLLEKIQKFMYGRYGIDELSNLLFKIYIIVFLINLFLDNKLLLLTETIIIFIMIYRTLSKRINKRRNENKKYLNIRTSFNKRIKNLKDRVMDRSHIYKKCSKCKTILKLPIPNKRGIKHTTCPKCKKRITLFTLREVKVEIIRKNRRNKTC